MSNTENALEKDSIFSNGNSPVEIHVDKIRLPVISSKQKSVYKVEPRIRRLGKLEGINYVILTNENVYSMAKRAGRRWNSCLAFFVSSVGALLYSISCINAVTVEFKHRPPPAPVFTVTTNNPASTEHNAGAPKSHSFEKEGPELKHPSSCPAKESSVKDSFIAFVSTLDGQVAAVDVRNEGKLLWDIYADVRPLLSSSISKLEILRNGLPTRLIPSLDGGLYQYDGESIEAVPMTADNLLMSSNKLADNMMMVGGRDQISYGINPSSGQVRYACNAAECNYFGDKSVSDSDDILVIRRNTHTVRAVDSRSGSEKWNFSVGQHEIDFLPGHPKPHDHPYSREDDDYVTVTTCGDGEEDDDGGFGDEILEDMLRIGVPEGIILGLEPKDNDAIRWQHTFPSPIAKVWLLIRGKLKPISVFDTRHIPSASRFPSGEDLSPSMGQPLLYLGSHMQQLYVQPSNRLKDHVNRASSRGSNNKRLDMPRVSWKPYLVSPSRTPLLRGTGKRDVPLLEQCQDSPGAESTCPSFSSETQLSVWHENYPFDNGYYLYPEFDMQYSEQQQCESKEAPNDDQDSYQNSSDLFDSNIITNSLWFYWREVLAISVFSTITVNILLSKLRKRRKWLKEKLTGSSGDFFLSDINMNESTSSDANPPTEYVSRYETDFKHVQVLGKGGYGIVFEACNKMDDCHYAVKRIELRNSEKYKEKMRREVKALAKMEYHPNIVRYYHAWSEWPPLGWKDNFDKTIDDNECFSIATPCNSVTQVTSHSTPDMEESHAVINIPKSPDKEINKPFGGQPFGCLGKGGGSEEFSVHNTSEDWSLTESGLFPKSLSNKESLTSLQVRFGLSESDEDSGSCSNDIPFSHLDGQRNDEDNSFSIVFEESEKSHSEGQERYNSGSGGQEGIEHSNSTDDGIVFQDDSQSSGVGKCVLQISSTGGTKSNSIIEKSSLSSHMSKNKNNNQEDARENHPREVITADNSVNKRNSQPQAKMYIYIQMQLCQRETLKDWLAANNLPRDISTVLDIFSQIVCAVEYVHDIGLMHRDLKPSNIFFSTEGVIKIGDFGLVTALSEEELEEAQGYGAKSLHHTSEVGTKLYMAPELVSGKPYGHKVDIFSLGMILFELLCPFTTQMERIHTLMGIKRRHFPPHFLKDYPVQTKYVEWLLSENPCDRPSATEIMDSDLLKDFRQANPRTKPRHRTVSSSSSSLESKKQKSSNSDGQEK